MKGGAQRVLVKSEGLCERKVKVILRVRPFLLDETVRNSTVLVESDTVEIVNPRNQEEVLKYRLARLISRFNACYDSSADQETIFDEDVKPFIENIVKGVNTTIFAYGNTGAGKTYTMMGTKDNPGIIPRLLKEVFSRFRNSKNYSCTVQMSFLEIYKEKVYDLLNPSNQDLMIRQDQKNNIVVPNLAQIALPSYDDFEKRFNLGLKNRSVAATNLNAESSRSHSILMLQTECTNLKEPNRVMFSKFHLIDLAGSEDNRRTDNIGVRMEESGSINKSLFVLGQVVDAINSRSPRIPYRDSKLTRLLQDSLGGDSHSMMIANISPNEKHFIETFNTLNFATKSKQIVNRPMLNLIQQQKMEETRKSDSFKEKRKVEAEPNNLKRQKMKSPVEDPDWSEDENNPFVSETKKSRKVPIIDDDDEKENDFSYDASKSSLPVGMTPFRELKQLNKKLKSRIENEILQVINLGNLKDIKKLKGIGEKRAQKIVEMRQQFGELSSLESLELFGFTKKVVHGIVKANLVQKIDLEE